MTTNNELLERRNASIPKAAATAHPVFIARAYDAELWDVEGKRYIDFAAGIGVNSTGNLHPKVVKAMTQQLERYAHVAFPVTAYEPYIEVCERLNAVAPIQDARSVLFTTGAEAVENAVKVARAHTGRLGVISFTGSFHGRTQLAMSMTGKVAPLRTGTLPTQAGVFHAPFPIPHHGMSESDSLRALDHIFRSSISPDQVAAIIIEPVQGEGGFYQAPASFMQALRSICDRAGICLISDEIQSGFGRTGKFFAIEHSEVEPDLITVGKAVGGGLPLAGLIGKAQVFESLPPGALGGTFAGNPVACAAAIAVMDLISEERLLERANAIGERLTSHLRKLKEQANVVPIGDVRHLGAMAAFEILTAPNGQPDADTTKAIAEKARKLGLLMLPCGYYGNTIRISTPLTITDAFLDEGIELLARAVTR